MDATSSRRRTGDAQDGEQGLAEWTSKIKAMQRQVDADEEAEQRRLEDEIRASRLARTRRSTGYQSSIGNRPFTPPVDETPEEPLDRTQSHSNALRKLTGGSSTTQAAPISLAQFMGGNATGPRLNKHAPQQDAHDPTQYEQRSVGDIKSPHPIFGRGGVAMPGMTSRHTEHPSTASDSRHISPLEHSAAKTPPITKARTPEPMLAPTHTRPSRTRTPEPAPEKAISTTTTLRQPSWDTAPRFSTPSPQPEVPAPIGRKAAAGERPRSRPTSFSGPSISAQASQPREPPPMLSSPPAMTSPPIIHARSEDPATAPKPPFEPSKAKAPSLPISSAPVISAPPLVSTRSLPPATAPKPAFARVASQNPEPVSLAQFMGGRATGPRLNKHAPQQDAHDPTQFEHRSTSDITSPHPIFGRGGVAMPGMADTAKRSVTKASSASPPPLGGSSITTPSLARPIQPAPRTPPGPQIAVSSAPSQAFLHAPPPKDLTPSLSRLQGRGFVKNMVHKSSELQSTATGTGANELGRVGSGKKPSVLDRWQPSVPEPSSPTATSPRTPPPKRKSFTVEVTGTGTSTGPSSPSPTQPLDFRRSLKSVASMPSMSSVEPAQVRGSSPEVDTPPLSRAISPQKIQGIGSSSTMISYIKPMKTGDDPTTSYPAVHRPTTPSSNTVDELGVRSWGRSAVEGGRGGGQSSEARASRPLSHPTKDRARKPKKAASSTQQEDEIETHVETPRAASPPVAPSLAASALEPPVIERPRSVSPPSPNVQNAKLSSESPLITPPSTYGELAERRGPSPGSPSRHKRIPSTGSRATVMDVAQAMQEEHMRRASADEQLMLTPSPTPPPPELEEEVDGEIQSEDFEPLEEFFPPSPSRSPIKRILSPMSNAEKRRSNYEKYASIILPPLAEENTPTPSPANTLSKTDVVAWQQIEAPTAQQLGSRLSNFVHSVDEDEEEEEQEEESQETHERPVPAVIRTTFLDQPLPQVDVQALLRRKTSAFITDPDIQTVSIEVLQIQASTATSISQDTNVFYDTDVLAIIHRGKSKSAGLVSTQVWGWRGKQSTVGEREERKLAELGKRYGTDTIQVYQYAESPGFVHTLGGKLAIRQGSRAHWSKENTAMHLVRSMNGCIFIDELDLNVRNLCSGFSYCLSILDTVYVWHGRGSNDSERDAAREYGQSLSGGNGYTFLELFEGVSDDDEMFWMILGEPDYAKASYWRFRPTTEFVTEPRVWCVEARNGKDPVRLVDTWAQEFSVQDHIYIIDCIYEFFVLVGSEVRGSRLNIRLALSVASDMATMISMERPFPPTLHVLIAPTQLPGDLRLAFRDLDEERVNLSVVPDHMNLLEAQEAYDHLTKTVWSKTEVQDESMLPLGMQSSPLPSPST